jgi:hypothetical protein
MPGVRDLWSYGETGFHSLATAVVLTLPREALTQDFASSVKGNWR